MKSWLGIFVLFCALEPTALAKEYSVLGMVVTTDPAHRTFSASIQEIPGFMPAMVMPFEVAERKELDGLTPGIAIEFTLNVGATSSRAEHIRVVRYQGIEQDPSAAARLKLLTTLNGAPSYKRLRLGVTVPDFELVDQRKERFALSSTRGKVVAINFIYTSCPLPNFCLRIANNFGILQQRFKEDLGRDLELVTVTFDPVHDTPDALAQYANRWHANAGTWHFLTGPVPDVTRVCHFFGVDFFPDEGVMNHSLHTAIVDRRGILVANIEGNQFTSRQLSDVVKALLDATERR